MSILKGIKILEDLNFGELSSLEMFCQERFIKAGENIFLKGDEANSMYLLKDGRIEIFYDKDDNEIVLGYIDAEDIFGEMALFKEHSYRMAGARAIKDSVLIVILDFSLKELLKNHPEIIEKIKKIIEKRNDENKKLL